MSSSGINPLAILAPDLYVKQLAIQRRQALAQSLLQSGEDPGRGAYGGVRSAGNAILGAFLAKRGDQDMANLYSGQSGDSSPQPSPQLTNMADQSEGPAPSPQPQPGASSPQISNMPGTGPQMPTNPAMGQPLQGNPPARANTIPQAMNGAVPDLPGLSHQQSMLAYLQSPNAYFTALAAANAPTPDEKNANFATGNNADQSKQLVLGGLLKGASDNLRPGGGSINYATGQVITMPNTNGVQTTFPQGINAPAQMGMVQGAAPALAQSSMATNAGQQSVKPFTGFDAGGMPVATNNLAMTGNSQAQGLVGQPQGQVPNIERNNPLNVSPGGSVAQYATPTAGLGAAWDNLTNYANKGVNTIAGVMNAWAPVQDGSGKVINPSTPQNIQMIAQKLGVDPNQPINLKDPNVKGQLIDLMRPTETGNRYAGAGRQTGGLMPALPASQGPYMADQGKDAADRQHRIVDAASESPMRINVLDNIIKLSQSGVGTGPGAEFQNSIKGYIANTPGIGKLFGGTQANVGNFQELQKFMYQNALRNWQAAGGTGTDSQLESAAKANPNDHLFPQALQTIAKWGKASELAVQGKANAQDAFLAQNGQTPQNQLKFENTWRNAFDPKVFQYSQMSSQEKQTFAQQELKTPQAAKAFIAKQQQLQALGALQ